MTERVSTTKTCDTCGTYIVYARNLPKDTSEDCSEIVNNYINPNSRCTKCLEHLDINIEATVGLNRIHSNKLKKSTEIKISKTQKRRETHNQKNDFITKNRFLIAVIVGLLIGSVIHQIYFIYFYDNSNNPIITTTTLKSTLERLSDRFPSLEKSFLKKVNGAFLRLKTPGEPFVFLFLHNDLNKKSTDCLASYTSLITKENIFKKTLNGLWMNASEWIQYSDDSDFDLLHNKLIEPLQENEVLILENLQDLPWSLAKSLHYLCDSINPKIAHVMFLLELKVNVNKLEELTEADKLIVAEKAMHKVWINATNSFRAALISRLTSYVDAVLLKSDEECQNSAIQPLHSDRSFIKILP